MPPSPTARIHQHRAHRSSSLVEAESLVSEAYLPHRLHLPEGGSSVDLEFVSTRVGVLTIGRASYGRAVVIETDAVQDVHVAITVRGRADMRSGSGPTSTVELGSAVVFPAGEPAHISMSEDCAVLAITVPRAAVEAELEHLLGQSLARPLELAFDFDLTTPLGRSWDPLLRLLNEELRRPTSLTQHPGSAKRLECLILDALLLGHDHNYREQLDRSASMGPLTAVGRAVELVETDPLAGWSTERLAREVHLSVRALQAGFRREIGTPPMDYVRQARLRHVHMALIDGSPTTTSVRALAQRHGFSHLGRFAATYRERYGVSPVETLRAPPEG